MTPSHLRRSFLLDPVRTAAAPETARVDTPVAAPTHPGRLYIVGKRVMDIVVATAGLVVLSPFLLLLAIVIRLESPGPSLYRAPRVGKDLRRFRMFKFRTMRCEAGDSAAPDGAPDWTLVRTPGYRKPCADVRVTRLGRWLRRSSIDEIPNLLNVLRGEMSLVGPRPSGWAPESYGDDVAMIFSIPPGITGLWQVLGRSELSFAERIALDRTYVRHRSLTLDLWILWRTIPAVLTARGAY